MLRNVTYGLIDMFSTCFDYVEWPIGALRPTNVKHDRLDKRKNEKFVVYDGSRNFTP